MKRLFLLLLILLGAGCEPRYPSQPEACFKAQERLTELDCIQKATPGGSSFESVCLVQLGVYPAGCLWELDRCENFDKYYNMEGCE
jgi:hypothetical protein